MQTDHNQWVIVQGMSEPSKRNGMWDCDYDTLDMYDFTSAYSWLILHERVPFQGHSSGPVFSQQWVLSQWEKLHIHDILSLTDTVPNHI